MTGRSVIMDDPEQREKIAEMYGKGVSRAEIGAVFNVHPDTVRGWLRKPEMQALVAAVRLARANRIVRLTDAAILGRIETPEARKLMSLKDLLEIRKTFQPTSIEIGRSGDSAAAELAAWDELDKAADQPAAHAELVEGEIVE